MSKLAKSLAAAAGNAGADAPNVEKVFSTYLYDGTGSAQTITNGIDLDGEGGMVWHKSRSLSGGHSIVDTVRGSTKILEPNSTGAEVISGSTQDLTSFNSNGFSLGTPFQANWQNSGSDSVSWTFKKAERFFDIVTYSGQATDLTVQHSLGVIPGMIIVKDLTVGGDWKVHHISLGEYKELALNKADTSLTTNGWNGYVPTDVDFQVNGGQSGWCEAGHEYVAYIFAHDPDGENDDGMIACGSYTGNGIADSPEINLGWEAQYVLVKKTTGANNSWGIFDSMRGMDHNAMVALWSDTSGVEITTIGSIPIYPGLIATANGFKCGANNSTSNSSGETYVYMAIRAPMMKEPEAGTEVFAIDNSNASDIPAWTSGFPVDMVFWSDTTGDNHKIASRLTGARVLETDTTGIEVAQGSHEFDYSDGFYSATRSSVQYAHMFKRAKGFFDVVAYTGNGTAGRTVNHSLGVAPEMMWVKGRDVADMWVVYHSGNTASPETDYLRLDASLATTDEIAMWQDTAPTDTQFTLGAHSAVSATGKYFIAYLFASLDGVSKVGSYTGTGTDLNVDCGFSAGARFILIKRTDATSDWWMWDTERGIVAGNDPVLSLNSTAAQVTTTDYIDPHAAGFTVTVNGNYTNGMNVLDGTYIFLAIA